MGVAGARAVVKQADGVGAGEVKTGGGQRRQNLASAAASVVLQRARQRVWESVTGASQHCRVAGAVGGGKKHRFGRLQPFAVDDCNLVAASDWDGLRAATGDDESFHAARQNRQPRAEHAPALIKSLINRHNKNPLLNQNQDSTTPAPS